MKISELPLEVKELALLRQQERPIVLESDYLDDAFSWFYTEEGTTYWNEWHLKDFVEPKTDKEIITEIIQKKIDIMEMRKFPNYNLAIGILKDLIREIK